jgi:phage-related minor tail protein
MNSDERTQREIDKEHAEEFDDLRFKDIGSYMELLDKLIEKLQAAVKILPKVDEKGRSECPFAERLYAEKEKAEEKLAEELNKASGYLDLVKEEIAMWKRNFTQIKTDADGLSLPQARQEYNKAKEATNIQINKNLKLQEKLLDLISKAEQHLQLSQEKKWPFGKPKEGFSHVPILGGSLGNVGAAEFNGQSSVSQTPALNTEIDSLMSLGPLK